VGSEETGWPVHGEQGAEVQESGEERKNMLVRAGFTNWAYVPQLHDLAEEHKSLRSSRI
jgi:hypothetical protein